MTLKEHRDNSTTTADVLLRPLRESASTDYIGEPISQLEHALQAAHMAEKAGAGEAAILAALFHDVGHLIDSDAPQMDGLGTIEHERLGADWLRGHGISDEVAHLVEAHVDAKRYLCSRNTDYYDRLSEASKGTLAFQGGPMSEAERLTFEQRDDFAQILALRSWDERAKEIDANVPPLEHYIDLIDSNLLLGAQRA